MPRATTAACEVMPPRVVRMPSAACMPWISSGEVSTRTRMTFLSCALSASASSAENTIPPDAAALRDLLWRWDARDHVLALGIDQDLAVEPFLAGRGIARERHAGRRGLAHVSEHHGLHVDRGAPAFRDVVQAAIGDGALVHP